MEKKICSYIKTWEQRCYHDGLPDEGPAEIKDLVPSYKRIAIAVLKNDYALQSLGFTPPKSKYYDQLKKIELKERKHKLKKYVRYIQLKLF